LDLPPELETELAAEAARLGLPLSEYALRLLAGARGPSPALRNGAELLAYWQSEALVGTRPDIADSAAHARELREQAQRRTRPARSSCNPSQNSAPTLEELLSGITNDNIPAEWDTGRLPARN